MSALHPFVTEPNGLAKRRAVARCPLVPAIRFANSISVVPRSTRTVACAHRDYPAVTPANNRSDFPKSRHRVPERHLPRTGRSLQDRRPICNFTNGPTRDGCRSCLRRRSGRWLILCSRRRRLLLGVLLRLQRRNIFVRLFLPDGGLLFAMLRTGEIALRGALRFLRHLRRSWRSRDHLCLSDGR